jgi:hypothetical protein
MVGHKIGETGFTRRQVGRDEERSIGDGTDRSVGVVVGVIIALVAVIALDSVFGSF